MQILKLKQYVVDAFTDTVFKGNPAAVCLLPEWISDTLMQNIAKENNLSETAFTVRKGNEYGSSGQVIKRDEAERYGR